MRLGHAVGVERSAGSGEGRVALLAEALAQQVEQVARSGVVSLPEYGRALTDERKRLRRRSLGEDSHPLRRNPATRREECGVVKTAVDLPDDVFARLGHLLGINGYTDVSGREQKSNI